ncbi:MAG: SMP-30/gluconolactonase/LRE family protein, partial [Mesorhizobium sp.]
AFVGRNADRLAVTSAWSGKDEKQRLLDPQAGMTFLLDIPVNGRFEPRVLIA